MADEIQRLARESWPEECCGMILADASEPSLGVRLLHSRNVERRDRRRRYRLDHRVHIRAIEEERRCGARIVGYYHSHPAGSAQPSALDAESGVPGVTYVVAGLAGPPELRAWRCTGGGFQEEAIFVEGGLMDKVTPALRLKSEPRLRRYQDIRELIASPANPTPLVSLGRAVRHDSFQLFLKLEWMNPFGSIKDRTAKFLLEGLLERQELDRGKQLVEPTSGNTGIALAALAAIMGMKLTVTIPEGVPEEKQILLRMLGAEVWPTPDDLCPIDHPRDGAIALAHSFVKGEAHAGRYIMPNQYENPDNVRAHYETTGPEIWNQTEGEVRYFFAGFGTCGTITGVGRFLKEKNPEVQIIAIEPQKGHRLPGLKNLEESKPPSILDPSVIDHVIRVDDEPAYAMTKRLFREEGLIVGPSTGAIVHAAVEFGRDREGVAVAISPDSGFKYASYFVGVLGDEGKPEV